MKIREVHIGGGLARSRCLVQILSSVLALPVTCFEVSHVTSWGTAMCAAVGSGSYLGLDQAMEAMRPRSTVIEPDPVRVEEYPAHYQRWVSTARWLDELGQATG